MTGQKEATLDSTKKDNKILDPTIFFLENPSALEIWPLQEGSRRLRENLQRLRLENRRHRGAV